MADRSPAPTDARVTAGRRILAGAGTFLLVVGILAVLFVAFALWGSGFLAGGDQGRLRAELDRRLPAGAGAAAVTPRRAHARDGSPRPLRPPPAVTARGPGSTAPVAAQGPVAAPTGATPPAGEPVATIQIASIGLDMVVVQGVAAAQLALGPGHYPGTALPGEAGNVGIAGHRTTWLHPFYSLTAVQTGTPVVLTTPQGVFVYTVQSTSVVAPTDVAVVGPAAGNVLTLTTCNPRYSAATRLVVRATLTRSSLFGSVPPSVAGAAGATAVPAVAAGHRTAPSRRDRPRAARNRSATTGPALAAAGMTGSAAAAAGWGAAAAVAAAGTWLLTRRSAGRARRARRLLRAAGAGAALVALFLCYAALLPLLPPTW